MKKILFTLIIALTAVAQAAAYDFEVDGIYYNYTSDSEVAVTQSSYNGNIIIPHYVIHDKTYTVSSIEGEAFLYLPSPIPSPASAAKPSVTALP